MTPTDISRAIFDGGVLLFIIITISTEIKIIRVLDELDTRLKDLEDKVEGRRGE